MIVRQISHTKRKKIELYDVTMTSHYVIVTNKLYLDDRNNDYIVLCKLGSHTISGYRVTGVGPPEPPPGPGKQKKKLGLNRVKKFPCKFIYSSWQI